MDPLSPFDRDEYHAAHPRDADGIPWRFIGRVFVAGLVVFAVWGVVLWVSAS